MHARFPLLVLLVGMVAGMLAAAHAAADEGQRPSIDWIWHSPTREAGQTVCFRRELTLDALPDRAELALLADFCHSRLLVNGTPLAASQPYQQVLTLDVSGALVEGANVVEVCCRSADGPAAVMAQLTLVAGGETTTITTDSTWKAARLPDGARLETPPGESLVWKAAVSLGAIDRYRYGLEQEPIAISPLDDYTQWKRAIEPGRATDPRTFEVVDGFEVELIHSATREQDSWVSLAAAPDGRWIIGQEQQGLLRLSIPPDGGDAHVERINETLRECRGLQFQGDALYALANNDKALYRLRDTTGDDRFDQVERLIEFEGDVGHGRNQLTLGPDGKLYGIFGDAVFEPENLRSLPPALARPTEADKTRNGFVIRFEQDLAESQVLVRGLRNPYGIAINAAGDMFTYDADAEYDMGSSWYRPTRMLHLIPGGDYRWRRVTQQWPPYFPDMADMPQPTLDIGKGSPTAVVLGGGEQFPPRYRDALYLLDWAYGRILAVHLTPRGSSYHAAPETFLRGQPLNVTDVEFGPDGAMYFTTGGRKTQSALYRVRYTGKQPQASPPSEQQIAREEHARKAGDLRRRWHRIAADGAEPDDKATWSDLGSADPWIRHAARTALEGRPLDSFPAGTLSAGNLRQAMAVLVALTRAEEELPAAFRSTFAYLTGPTGLWDRLDECGRLEALFVAQALLAEGSPLDEQRRRQIMTWLESRYPLDSWQLNRSLSNLLSQQPSDQFAATTMRLLEEAADQQQQFHYLFVLRNAERGWTPELRSRYFEHLRRLDDFVGGEGMPTFRRLIRQEAIASLPEAERPKFAALLEAGRPSWHAELPTEQRAHVRQWKPADFAEAPLDFTQPRDLENGRRVFDAAACVRCHRMGRRGEASGPDLTAVASRFSPRDMLVSILEPSQVISEKYAASVFELADGRVVSGRIAPGDYRSAELEIVPNLLEPEQTVRVAKAAIVRRELSPVSAMPSGLLDTFDEEEILDLLAYLIAGRE